jgi:flagellar biosynthesis anti-sigma factor FlgM
MKIDPRIPSSNEVQNDPIKTAKGASAQRTSDTKASDPSSLASGDTVQLSSRHAEIQRLNAQAANVPEIRSERIAPLQTQVKRGTYNPDSSKVADAMVNDHAGKSSRA